MIKVGVLLALFSVLIAGIAQIILKKAANANKSKHMVNKFISGGVAIGYMMMLLASLMNVFALKHIELKILPAIDAISYIYIPVLSCLLLKEKITRNVVFGAGLIIIGIMFFAMK